MHCVRYSLTIKIICQSSCRLPIASSQSSSCVVNALEMESPSCWYGLKVPLKFSHTNKNPKRKFYACPNYNMIINLPYFLYFFWMHVQKLLYLKLEILELYAGRNKMSILHLGKYTSISTTWENPDKREWT